MYMERDNHPRAKELADLLVPPDMLAWLQNEQFGRQAVDETLAHLGKRLDQDEISGPKGQKLLHKPDEVRLLSPILRPNTIRDCMLFLEHVRRSMELEGLHEELAQFMSVQDKLPAIYYKGNPCTVVGPDSEIVMYPGETRHDFECEVCCIIGRTAKNVTPEKILGPHSRLHHFQ